MTICTILFFEKRKTKTKRRRKQTVKTVISAKHKRRHKLDADMRRKRWLQQSKSESIDMKMLWSTYNTYAMKSTSHLRSYVHYSQTFFHADLTRHESHSIEYKRIESIWSPTSVAPIRWRCAILLCTQWQS